MKRILAIMLAVCMVFGFAAISVAAEGNEAVIVETGTEYATFAAANTAATEGQTIKLLQNVTIAGGGGGLLLKNNATVDLGGYTITSTGTRLFNTTAGADSTYTIKNGSIEANVPTCDTIVILRSTNSLVLENLTANITKNTGITGVFWIHATVASDPTVVTATNCDFTANSGIFSDNNATNGAWNLYIYNCKLNSTAYSAFLKKDNAKTYDHIIYSAHVKQGYIDGRHYPNLKVGANSYLTLIENGGEETASTSFAQDEYWVYEKGNPLAVDCSMKLGASMRLKAKSGIRFYTNVDKDKIAALKADGATVEMGTLIAPANLINGELKFADENDIYAENDNYAVVPFTSENYYTEDDFAGVVGSVVDVKDKNAKRDFVGRGYIKVTKGDESFVSYASYSNGAVADNTRSVGWIAKQVKVSDEYNALSAEYKAVVDKYADLYDTPEQ